MHTKHFSKLSGSVRTLAATGAGDGKVHFFRIEDGYEVLHNFVPNAALDDLSAGVEEPGKGGLSADGELVARNMIICRSLVKAAQRSSRSLNNLRSAA